LHRADSARASPSRPRDGKMQDGPCFTTRCGLPAAGLVMATTLSGGDRINDRVHVQVLDGLNDCERGSSNHRATAADRNGSSPRVARLKSRSGSSQAFAKTPRGRAKSCRFEVLKANTTDLFKKKKTTLLASGRPNRRAVPVRASATLMNIWLACRSAERSAGRYPSSAGPLRANARHRQLAPRP